MNTVTYVEWKATIIGPKECVGNAKFFTPYDIGPPSILNYGCRKYRLMRTNRMNWEAEYRAVREA